MTCSLLCFLIAVVGSVAEYSAPKECELVLRDFRFHNGQVLPELRLHYMTVGAPTGEPVLILHGIAASGDQVTSRRRQD